MVYISTCSLSAKADEDLPQPDGALVDPGQVVAKALLCFNDKYVSDWDLQKQAMLSFLTLTFLKFHFAIFTPNSKANITLSSIYWSIMARVASFF